jgi:hypothetical protein
MNPIIPQAPNRDANSVKLIRPVQGTFSGLQHPPDSDRFTLEVEALAGDSQAQPPLSTPEAGFEPTTAIWEMVLTTAVS